jgi:predicted NAD/FAD-binding protein
MSLHQTKTSLLKRLAIVGGGISGIACSWTLQAHDVDVEIHKISNRLGGHANSVLFKGKGRSVDVDTGFIAMDETMYRKSYFENAEERADTK